MMSQKYRGARQPRIDHVFPQAPPPSEYTSYSSPSSSSSYTPDTPYTPHKATQHSHSSPLSHRPPVSHVRSTSDRLPHHPTSSGQTQRHHPYARSNNRPFKPQSLSEILQNGRVQDRRLARDPFAYMENGMYERPIDQFTETESEAEEEEVQQVEEYPRAYAKGIFHASPYYLGQDGARQSPASYRKKYPTQSATFSEQHDDNDFHSEPSHKFGSPPNQHDSGARSIMKYSQYSPSPPTPQTAFPASKPGWDQPYPSTSTQLPASSKGLFAKRITNERPREAVPSSHNYSGTDRTSCSRRNKVESPASQVQTNIALIRPVPQRASRSAFLDQNRISSNSAGDSDSAKHLDSRSGTSVVPVPIKQEPASPPLHAYARADPQQRHDLVQDMLTGIVPDTTSIHWSSIAAAKQASSAPNIKHPVKHSPPPSPVPQLTQQREAITMRDQISAYIRRQISKPVAPPAVVAKPIALEREQPMSMEAPATSFTERQAVKVEPPSEAPTPQVVPTSEIQCADEYDDEFDDDLPDLDELGIILHPSRSDVAQTTSSGPIKLDIAVTEASNASPSRLSSPVTVTADMGPIDNTAVEHIEIDNQASVIPAAPPIPAVFARQIKAPQIDVPFESVDTATISTAKGIDSKDSAQQVEQPGASDPLAYTGLSPRPSFSDLSKSPPPPGQQRLPDLRADRRGMFSDDTLSAPPSRPLSPIDERREESPADFSSIDLPTAKKQSNINVHKGKQKVVTRKTSAKATQRQPAGIPLVKLNENGKRARSTSASTNASGSLATNTPRTHWTSFPYGYPEVTTIRPSSPVPDISPDPLPVLDLPALPAPDVQAQYDDTYELLESVKDVSEKEVEDVLESTTDHIATLPTSQSAAGPASSSTTNVIVDQNHSAGAPSATAIPTARDLFGDSFHNGRLEIQSRRHLRQVFRSIVLDTDPTLTFDDSTLAALQEVESIVLAVIPSLAEAGTVLSLAKQIDSESPFLFPSASHLYIKPSAQVHFTALLYKHYQSGVAFRYIHAFSKIGNITSLCIDHNMRALEATYLRHSMELLRTLWRGMKVHHIHNVLNDFPWTMPAIEHRPTWHSTSVPFRERTGLPPADRNPPKKKAKTGRKAKKEAPEDVDSELELDLSPEELKELEVDDNRFIVWAEGIARGVALDAIHTTQFLRKIGHDIPNAKEHFRLKKRNKDPSFKTQTPRTTWKMRLPRVINDDGDYDQLHAAVRGGAARMQKVFKEKRASENMNGLDELRDEDVQNVLKDAVEMASGSTKIPCEACGGSKGA